ncbi:MAG: pyruvate, phosphate dikinase, partial [Actinomycetia bacterium]|nr:pyruvate, phosphate dikinase [Actinomycetes bacterium]
GEDRLPIMQDMILADSSTERDNALAKLLPVQKSDFEKIFRVMEELPVTIRLLDPPLHEFLPDLLDLKLEIEEMKRGNAKEEEIIKKENLAEKVRLMSEANPMLGLRGCRLGLTFPSIYEMQVRAIAEAATNVTREGIKPDVEIMIPLVSTYNELKVLRIITEKVLKNVTKETGVEIEYKIGTMIELPRAAVTADEIVEYADFFSFGTNDLTQTTYGFSRDDAEGKFLPKYLEEKILPENPFEVLDVGGVGKLVETACNLGRKVKPDIKLGICGEHGGEPKSIEFCHNIGLTYISCSPFRVPVARLAAAQAVLKKV